MTPASPQPDGWQLAEVHLFEQLGETVLLNVRSGRSYAVDEPTAAFVRTALEAGAVEAAAAEVRRRWGWWRLGHLWHELQREAVIARTPAERPIPPPPLLPPITSLDLNVTHQCNLACRYCYGAYGTLLSRTDGQFRYGSKEGWMSQEVAEAAFDWLLRESGDAPTVSVILFGGEPLLNMALIERIVPLFRQRAKAAGKRLGLSTATNATLLTDRKLRFLAAHNIGIQFSLDGPPDVQDDQRCDRWGHGTYDRVIQAAQRLFALRPGSITARATLSRKHLQLRRVVEHLLSLGFGNVHVEPATGVDNEYAITPDCLPDLRQQYTDMAELFLERLDQGELFNFSNFVKHIRGTKAPEAARFHPCGAGRGYLCVDPEGTIYLCHRFTGSDEYALGNIRDGMDNRLRQQVAALHVDARPGCRDCWARYFCGGGCWRVNVDATGSLAEPDLQFACQIHRHIIELSMAINARLADTEAELLGDQYAQARLPYEH